MNELSLFAGAGGGLLGGKLLGWRTVCAVENEPYARSVLVRRQNDGSLEPFEIWDDVRTFDGKPWDGIIDVVSGGFPCQDISSAGRGAGIDGAKSGLWKEMARIIGEVRPSFVFVENSPMLTSRGLGTVLGDLASMGFNAEWGVLGARHVGAPHKRDRIWIVAANSDRKRRGEEPKRELGGCDSSEPRDDGSKTNVADANRIGRRGRTRRTDGTQTRDSSQPLADTEPTRLEGLGNKAGQSEESQPRNDGGKVSNSYGYRRNQGRERITEARSDGPFGNSWWEIEPDVGLLVDELADWLVCD